MEKEMETFVSTLLHSGTNAHLFHWSTDSFAKHMALGTYYEEIIELVDDLAEAFMGCYGVKLTKFPNTYHIPAEPLAYFESLKAFVKDARKDLPTETELVQLVDNIADLIDSTIYKLKFLK